MFVLEDDGTVSHIKQPMPELSFAELLGMALLNEGETGISQLELAKRSGLSVGAISMLCNGKRQPTFNTVRKISNALSQGPGYWLKL